MSGNTPKGYPYPTGGDPMSQGDNILNQLATAVDQRLGAMAAGSVVFTRFATTNPDSVTVTYPVGRFAAGASVPLPQATANTTGPSSARVGCAAPTANGFTLNAWRESGTGNLTVYWAAQQQT